MNKEQYINELKSKLEGFDEELVKEIISDYEEHFNLGYAQGKSDEEICEQLGNIDDLVKEISESYERQDKRNDKGFEYRSNINIDLSSLNNLGEQLNKATENITKQVSDLVNNEFNAAFGTNDNDEPLDERIANKVSSFFENLYAPKNNHQDNEDSFNEVCEEQEFKQDKVKHVIVRNFKGEINVDGDSIINEGFNAQYECNGSLKEKLGYHMDFDFQNDTVILTLECANFMRNTPFSKLPEMELKLQVHDVESMVFENCGESDIRINDGNFQKVDVQTTSGELTITDSNVEELCFMSLSGDLRLSDCRSHAIDVKSTSGDLEFNDVVVHALRATTVSGDIIADDGLIERLGAVSTSGDVSINVDGLVQFACETISGDIEATLNDGCEARVKTTSGDLKLCLNNDEQGFTVKFKSLSGDADISYGDTSSKGLRSGEYRFGANPNSIKVTAASVSGDIDITD